MGSNALEEIKFMARDLPSDHGMRRFVLLVNHAPPDAAQFVAAIGSMLFHTQSNIRDEFHRVFKSLNASSTDTATYIIAETARHCLHLGSSAQSILQCASGSTRAEVAAVLSREKHPPQKFSPQPKRTAAGTMMPRYAPGPVQHVPPPPPPRTKMTPPSAPSAFLPPVTKKKP